MTPRLSAPGLALAACLALAAVLQLWVAALAQPSLLAGGLPDTDSYTHLLRALALWQEGHWFSPLLPALSAPEGLPLHWTRPLDVLILALALPLMLLGLPAAQVIFWAGALLCPLLYLAALWAAAWAARPVWGPGQAWLAAVLLLAQPAPFLYSLPGRADHHTLVLLCGLLTLGWGLRALLAEHDHRSAWCAGLAAGMGVWFSPEALLVALPVLASFAATWWLAAEGRGAATQGLRLAAGFAALLALALVVERPPGQWLLAEQDKVSVQHLAAAVMAGVALALARRCGGWGRGAKALLGLALAAAAVGVLLLLWPQILASSLADADAVAATMFLPFVQEMRPLWPGDAPGVLEAWFWLGLLPGALAMLALAPWRAALLLGLTLAATTAAALAARRFALDATMPACVLAAGLLPTLAARAAEAGVPRRLALLLAGTALLLLLPMAGGGIAAALRPAKPDEACAVAALADWLNQAMPVHETPAPVLLADSLNRGPELAWRTGYRLVAAPYHRGGAAMAATRAALAATEDASALALLRQRGTALLLLCHDAAPLGGPWPEAGLRQRLLAGAAVPGLEPVALPGELARHFSLYRLR